MSLKKILDKIKPSDKDGSTSLSMDEYNELIKAIEKNNKTPKYRFYKAFYKNFKHAVLMPKFETTMKKKHTHKHGHHHHGHNYETSSSDDSCCTSSSSSSSDSDSG